MYLHSASTILLVKSSQQYEKFSPSSWQQVHFTSYQARNNVLAATSDSIPPCLLLKFDGFCHDLEADLWLPLMAAWISYLHHSMDHSPINYWSWKTMKLYMFLLPTKRLTCLIKKVWYRLEIGSAAYSSSNKKPLGHSKNKAKYFCPESPVFFPFCAKMSYRVINTSCRPFCHKHLFSTWPEAPFIVLYLLSVFAKGPSYFIKF